MSPLRESKTKSKRLAGRWIALRRFVLPRNVFNVQDARSEVSSIKGGKAQSVISYYSKSGPDVQVADRQRKTNDIDNQV